MDGINHVSAVSIITLANDLISMGVPQVKIEKSLGRKITSFDDEEARIPLDILVSIENAAPQWTGDIAVGFALGMMGDVDSSKTGVVGYIARHSPTLVIAISQAILYANLISDGIQMDLVPALDLYQIAIQLLAIEDIENYELSDSFLDNLQNELQARGVYRIIRCSIYN